MLRTVIQLAMAPNISKDMLETILGVPSETIDGLLAGKPYEYDPHWGNAYSVLTQSLDLHTLRRDLRRLDIFLEREETVKHNTAMLRALRQHAEKSMKQQPKTLSINAQSPEAVPLHVCYTDIILSSEGSPSTWYFKYFPEQEDTDYFYPSDVFDDAVALADQVGYKVSIILTSVDEYNSMCRYCEKMEENDEGRAMLGIPRSLPPNISLIHFDRETEEVVGWKFAEPKFNV